MAQIKVEDVTIYQLTLREDEVNALLEGLKGYSGRGNTTEDQDYLLSNIVEILQSEI